MLAPNAIIKARVLPAHSVARLENCSSASLRPPAVLGDIMVFSPFTSVLEVRLAYRFGPVKGDPQTEIRSFGKHRGEFMSALRALLFTYVVWWIPSLSRLCKKPPTPPALAAWFFNS